MLPPAADWLDRYRQRVADWERQSLQRDAPWLDPASGSSELHLPADRATLQTVLAQGWLSGENEAFWGGEGPATVRVPVAQPARDYRIVLVARPFLAEANGFRQRVRVSIAGEPVQELLLDRDDFTPVEIRLPRSHVNAPWTVIELEFPDALVPAEIGHSPDVRQLGIAVVGLKLTPVADTGAAGASTPGDDSS